MDNLSAQNARCKAIAFTIFKFIKLPSTTCCNERKAHSNGNAKQDLYLSNSKLPIKVIINVNEIV